MLNQSSKIMIFETERQHPVLTEQHRVLNRFRKSFIILLLLSLFLPSLSFAQGEFGAAMPRTIGEAKDFVLGVLSKLPEAVKNVWQEEALPIWQKMWEWFFGFWESTIW